MVVGEAPGASELSRGQPFVGESGRLIRAVFKQLGVDPDEEVYWTNSVTCRPPGNKTPTPTAISACNGRLREEFDLVRPQKILALGGIGLTGVVGAKAVLPITKWRGKGFYSEIQGEKVYTVATYHPAAVLRDPDLFRDFVWDIEKFLTNDTPFEPEVETWIPTGKYEALEMLTQIQNASTISLDLETTGFDPSKDKILSWGFGVLNPDGVSGVSVIIPENLSQHLSVKNKIRELCEAKEHTLVLHNAKFDLKFVDAFFKKRMRPEEYNDTMLLHYGLDERPVGRYKAHGLKDLARKYYDAEDYAWDFEKFFATPEDERDYEGLYKYQGLDCYYTIRLHFDLLREVEEEGAGTERLLSEILLPATIAFKEIELYGAMVDIPYLKEMESSLVEEIEKKTEALKKLAIATGDFKDFNPASPVQVKSLVFNSWKLPSGGNTRYGSSESTDKEALQHLQKKTTDPKIQQGLKDIIDYRLRSKVLQTYVRGLLDRVGRDQRVRTDFQLHGTATGRLSSRDPNLQNIPTLMGQEIRDAFIAPEGYSFLEADFSQLELRVAAQFSGDEVMITTFKEGRDIHLQVAATMFQKDPKDVTEYERYLAKYVDFGILYGRGAKSLTEGWEMERLEEIGGKRWDLPTAEKFLRQFLNGFPQLRDWMKVQAEESVANQYCSTPLGRRRRFPLIPAGQRNAIARQSVNTPIQGTASDICVRALTRLHHRLDPRFAHILFTVHDSIAFEVRNDRIDEISTIIKEEMEGNLPFETEIPFPVDIKVGPRWGQAKKVKRGQ